MNWFAAIFAVFSAAISTLVKKWYVALLILVAGLSFYFAFYYGFSSEWCMVGDWRPVVEKNFKESDYMKFSDGNYFIYTDDGFINVRDISKMRYEKFSYSIELHDGTIKQISDTNIIDFLKVILEKED